MKVSVRLPATTPGAKGETIVEWARQADQGPFESLGIIDRVVYANHESLTTLAAAAGATRRIRLMSTVLSTPVRETVMLAKSVATLDSLSGGRVVLGVGLGGRKDDYDAVSADYGSRGRRLGEQVRTLRQIWAGEPTEAGVVGPPPAQRGGPEILMGANSPVALRRAGRLGDGYISTPNTPEGVRESYEEFLKAWREAGREGEPRLVGSAYYALGDEAALERGRWYLRDYYAYVGREGADMIAGYMVSSPDQVRAWVQGYESIGMDEVVFWPCVPELDQLSRLQDVIG